jgi:hypothetical protein
MGRNRKQMLSVLGELLGDEASVSVIRFYETSVLALCRGDWSAPRVPKSCAQEKRAIGAGKIEVLANQITQFLPRFDRNNDGKVRVALAMPVRVRPNLNRKYCLRSQFETAYNGY